MRTVSRCIDGKESRPSGTRIVLLFKPQLDNVPTSGGG